jgi:capsular polysaccharide biosynthesis protein
MKEIYREINLLEIIRIVMKRWWLIVGMVGLFGGMAYYVTDNYIVPVYEAKATLFVGKDTEALSDINLGDLQLDNKFVSDYRELIKTKLVTQQVITELGLDVTREEMVESLMIQVVSDSRFMEILYYDANPETASLVANRLAVVLADKAESIVGAKNVQIVDEAEVPIDPISPSFSTNMLLSGAIGAIIAMLIIFSQMILDNTIKREDEAEKLLGIPVLGMIPKFEGKARV